MRAQCCICQEQFENDAELVISALDCGHTFHGPCLTQWLENGNTCPSCRKPVKRKNIIDRLYFDCGDDTEGADPSKLQNDIDRIRLEVRQKEREKSEQEKINQSLKDKIKDLSSAKSKSEKLYKAEQSSNTMLRKQLEYYESHQTAVQQEREECRKIKKKMVEMQRLETLLNGCESDASDIIAVTGEGDAAVVNLSRQCALLKREYEKMKSEKKVLKEEVERYRKDCVYKTRSVEESKKEVSTLTDQLKRSEEDLKRTEGEVTSLKKKLSQLKHAIRSPCAAGSSSFVETLMDESPMFSSPAGRQKQINRENTVDLNVTPDLFDSPSYTQAERKRPLDTQEVKFMKISSAAENSATHPAKKLKKDVPDSGNIAAIASMNIFKKKAPGNACQSSVTRKGYNGFGGHETFINTTKGFSIFKKPPTRKPLSKLTKTPSLPKLDSYITID